MMLWMIHQTRSSSSSHVYNFERKLIQLVFNHVPPSVHTKLLDVHWWLICYTYRKCSQFVWASRKYMSKYCTAIVNYESLFWYTLHFFYFLIILYSLCVWRWQMIIRTYISHMWCMMPYNNNKFNEPINSRMEKYKSIQPYNHFIAQLMLDSYSLIS